MSNAIELNMLSVSLNKTLPLSKIDPSQSLGFSNEIMLSASLIIYIFFKININQTLMYECSFICFCCICLW